MRPQEEVTGADASVTVNTLRGMGAGNEIGLYFIAGKGRLLIVTSANNLVTDVKTARFAGNGVTLSEGY